jgi:hypothetical protein
VVRAVAVKPGFRSANVATRTIIFPNEVIGQPPGPPGFPNRWAGVAADYAMDPRIMGPNGGRVAASLRSLASVFLTTSLSNLFDAGRGIYANPESHGPAWERPASME